MGVQIKLFTLINIYLVEDWFYVISSHSASKSIAIVFGGVQKHFNSTHLSRHFSGLSWSLQNVFTCLYMQALAKSISCVKYT